MMYTCITVNNPDYNLKQKILHKQCIICLYSVQCTLTHIQSLKFELNIFYTNTINYTNANTR